MSQETRVTLVISRTGDYHTIMRTVFFTYAAVAAMIHLGPGGYSAPLTMLVVAAAAYGILAGGTALDDVGTLREDMDEATAATAYGKAVKARNIGALKMTSNLLLGLIAVAELYAIFV